MSIASREREKKKVSAIIYLLVYIELLVRLFVLFIVKFCLSSYRLLQNNAIANITDATFAKLGVLEYL